MRRPSLLRPDRRRAFRMFSNSHTRFALFVVALAAFASFATTAWSAVRYADPFTLPTGAAPSAVVASDLNGDNLVDFAVANSADATVSVYLTDGLGGYAPRVDYVVGLDPRAVLLESVDGVGFTDLIVANAGSNSVSVLHGHIDGTFDTRTDYAVGVEPVALALVELNDDGRPELVVANAGSSDFTVLFGTPSGDLGTRTDHPLPGSPRAIAVGEWNDYYGLDLAFTCAPNLVAVFGSDNAGALTAGAPVTVGNDPVGIVAGDFDDDGRRDLAVANRGSNSILLLLGMGGSAFGAGGEFAVGDSPGALVLEDADGDGYPDLVCSLEGEDAVEILRLRTYGLSARQKVTLGTGASSVRLVDVDQDQYFDLVALDAVTSTVQVRASLPLLTGTVTFATPPSSTPAGAVMSPPVEVLVLDENGEPFTDEPVFVDMEGNGVLLGAERGVLTDVNGIAVFDSLVTLTAGPKRLWAGTTTLGSEPSDYAVSALEATTLRFATEPTDVERGLVLPHPVHVQVMDMYDNPVEGVSVALSLIGPGSLMGGAAKWSDMDGYATFDSLRVDSAGLHRLVAACAPSVQATSAEFAVFPPPHAIEFFVRQAFPAGNAPLGVATGDLDGDGRLDLISANSQSASVSVLRGLGGGQFAAPVNYATGVSPVAVRVCDLDGDGRLDVIAANRGNSTVSILRGLGGGLLAPKVDRAVGLWPWAMVTGDFNSDGKLDLAVACEGNNCVTFLFAAPGGGFAPPVYMGTYVSPIGLAAEDLDGDGDLDLVVAGASTSVIAYRGDGQGAFTGPDWFSGVTYPRYITLADFDEDGRLDLAMASSIDGCVGVMRGDGNGAFGDVVRWLPDGAPYSLAVADVDGDGHLDLATSSYLTSKVSVLPGTGHGSFFSAQSFAAAPFPAQVVVADLNADGARDLVTADNTANTVSVFLNVNHIPVPTLIELLRAAPTAQGVRVEWRYADATALRSCVLERAESEEGEWVAVDRAPVMEAGLQVVVDDEAREGMTNWYRLSGTLRSGVAFTYGPVAADALGAVRVLELATPWPNPSRGAATLSYGLPKSAKVRLSLVDLQGREVAVLADGVREAGRHVALLDAADLRPGVYFARLRCGGASLVRRFVLVR